MAQITQAKFEEKLKEHCEYSTMKWTELTCNVIYTITDYKLVEISSGESMILTLNNNITVWTPARLKSKIEECKSKSRVTISCKTIGVKTVQG